MIPTTKLVKPVTMSFFAAQIKSNRAFGFLFTIF
jgi:hypothetical protein